jgi:hypothetical protein
MLIHHLRRFSFNNLKLIRLSSNFLISALLSLFFGGLYSIVGTKDLESRLTAIYSLAMPTKMTINAVERNIESILGMPVYDYDLGFGTNLPIVSGLNGLTGFLDRSKLSDSFFITISVTFFIFLTLSIFLYALGTICKFKVIHKIGFVFFLLFPLVVYIFINDWPDVAFSYLGFVNIFCAFQVLNYRPNNQWNARIISLVFSIGILLSLIGHVGYWPLTFTLILTYLLTYSKKIKLWYLLLSMKQKYLLFFVLFNAMIKVVNTYFLLLKESNGVEYPRHTQEISLIYSIYDFRQPNIFLIVMLLILTFIYFKRNKVNGKTELVVVLLFNVIIFLLSYLKIFAPSALWLVRDFIWLQLLILLNLLMQDLYQHKEKLMDNLNLKRIVAGFSLSFISFTTISPFYIVSAYTFKSLENSWTTLDRNNKSEFEYLLDNNYLRIGDRLYTAPSNLIRNSGGGLTGLISYNDLTANGIASISSWSKIRNSSALISGTKKFENKAMTEDCSVSTIRISAPSAVLVSKELHECLLSLQKLDFRAVWENSEYLLYRGLVDEIFLINIEPSLNENLNLEQLDCGWLETNCFDNYSNLKVQKNKSVPGGIFCSRESDSRGWCFDFDDTFKGKNILLPILYDSSIKANSDNLISEYKGLVSLQISNLDASNIRLIYEPTLLDFFGVFASFMINICMIITVFLILKHININNYIEYS